MFTPLMASEASRNLRRVFKLSEMLKDEAPKDGFKPRKVHVIGAGTMGGDIAAWCVVQGMQASLQDLDEAQIKKALARAKGLFKRQLRTPLAVDAAVARLIADPTGKQIKHADVVIEAIVEKLDVKQSAVPAAGERGEAGRGARHQHLLAEARGHRQAARRSGPPRRPAFLQSRGAAAAGRGGARQADARGGGAQGLRLRHRHRQAAADRQGLRRLPRQSRARAVHDGGGAPAISMASRARRSTRRRSNSACRWVRSS